MKKTWRQQLYKLMVHALAWTICISSTIGCVFAVYFFSDYMHTVGRTWIRTVLNQKKTFAYFHCIHCSGYYTLDLDLDLEVKYLTNTNSAFNAGHKSFSIFNPLSLDVVGLFTRFYPCSKQEIRLRSRSTANPNPHLNEARLLALPVVVSLINLLLPSLFNLASWMEDYHSPSVRTFVAISRSQTENFMV